jgi:AcrR family transcriptional regulator
MQAQVPTGTTRSRLVEAAFALFEEQGYDKTTVDEIASRAELGRTTFFRHFPGKEDVVFPDHDDVLRRVDARLSTATALTREAALREAARIVLDHYVDEGSTARARYRLTSTVPALREREIASAHRYQRVFTKHAQAWYADEPGGALRGELVGAAVITAHNHVLRDWLQEKSATPHADFDEAMATALPVARGDDPNVIVPQVIVTVSHHASVDDILKHVKNALT